MHWPGSFPYDFRLEVTVTPRPGVNRGQFEICIQITYILCVLKIVHIFFPGNMISVSKFLNDLNYM